MTQQNQNLTGQNRQPVYYSQPGYSYGAEQQGAFYSGQTFPQTTAGQPVGPFPSGAPSTQQYPVGMGTPSQLPPGIAKTPHHQSISAQVPGMLPIEESYIENILRLNKGKVVSVHTTFENNREWNAKIFNGVIEAAGRDHLILSDPQTGERFLIPMVFLDYVTFQEEIEYEPIFGGVSLTVQPPR